MFEVCLIAEKVKENVAIDCKMISSRSYQGVKSVAVGCRVRF